MDILKQFIDYLGVENNKSRTTVKNYGADIAQFIKWFEYEFKNLFNPNTITPQILEMYKNVTPISKRSLDRHLSSLRKFFHFLKIEGIISQDPFEQIKVLANTLKDQQNKWQLNEFKNHLYVYNKAPLTIKNYLVDVRQFLVWAEKTIGVNDAWNIKEKNIFDKINSFLVNEYKQRLLEQNFSPRSINRKLSSLRKFFSWAKDQGLIKTDSSTLKVKNENQNIQSIKDSISNPISKAPQSEDQVIKPKYSTIAPIRLLQKSLKTINFIFDKVIIIPLAKTIQYYNYFVWKLKGKPLFSKSTNPNPDVAKSKMLNVEAIPKSFYAPLLISTRNLPIHKKVWHHLWHKRPKWYKQYRLSPIAHYLHLAIFVIAMSFIGFRIYNAFLEKPNNQNQVLGVFSSGRPRIISFHGRLLDALNNPIATPIATLRMAIYNDSTASGSAMLWEELVSVSPDKDGYFSTFLGKESSIPQSVFFENPSLWLGISVGNTPELIPRQKLPTVDLAASAESLRGLVPITDFGSPTSNVILALDSSGNLNIGGSAAPTFQASGGQFTLSGNTLLLTTTTGSNTNVTINPDGLGTINLEKPLQNITNNNNIPSAIGAVEVDDLFAVLATSSGQSAITINQDALGPLISASASGTPKFTVDNNGNVISAKGAKWQPISDSTTALHVASSSGNPFVTFDSINSRVGIGTIIPQSTLDIIGTFKTLGDVTFSNFKSEGGILYTNAKGLLAQVAAGNSTQCLLGGSTPSFGPCQLLGPELVTNGGFVGIGTAKPLFKLAVEDAQSASAATQIFNTDTGTNADGLIVKLGNTSTSVANSNHFISFETSGIGIVGSVRGDGATGTDFRTSGIADFAEYLKKYRSEIIEYGSLICIDDKGLVLACDQNNTNMIGVASNHGGFTGGEDLGESSIRVGFVGQVYTRVSNVNGNIKPGDPLTSSSTPGVAVKTTKAGPIVGKALEAFSCTLNTSNENTNNHEQLSGPSCEGKILVSINVSWHDQDLLSGLGNFAQSIIKKLSVESLDIATNSVTIAGENLKDYIAQIVSQTLNSQLSTLNSNKIISPIAKIDELHTNIISPLASGSAVVVNGKLVIHPVGDSSQAKPDQNDIALEVQGDASVSGTLNAKELTSENINSNDASIAGILRAKRIIANEIEGLNTQTATLPAQYVTNNYIDIASYSAKLTSIDNLNTRLATFTQGLISFGSASLADTSIAGQLSVGGSLILADNSINVLGSDLQLQSLRQGGVSFLSGLVRIDENGNLKVTNNLTVGGKFVTNVIAPLPDKDLIIQNSSGSAVLSVNQLGDLIASGSGTFSKLNLSLIQPALALSQTELIATGSAGVANIKANQTEVTINNNLLTEKSLVYITPVGTPSAQTPYLLRQVPKESFTVGVQTPSPNNILFNWLIVN